MKLSEQVRRLEDAIESLILENKMLKEDTVDIRDEVIDHQNKEIAKLKEQIKKLTELNEQLTNTSDDGTKLIGQLKSELLARVKQVEDLQSSYKTLQDENKKLKSKLEQTVDEYDEDYQTFHDNRKCTEKCGKQCNKCTEKCGEGCKKGTEKCVTRDDNCKFDDNFRRIFREFLDDNIF